MANNKLSDIVYTLYYDFIAYLKKRFELYKLEAIEKGVVLTAYIFSKFILATLLAIFGNLIIIMLAFYFGYIYDQIATALLGLTLFYFLLMLIFVLFRRQLLGKPLQNQLISFIFSNSEDDKSESHGKKEK